METKTLSKEQAFVEMRERLDACALSDSGLEAAQLGSQLLNALVVTDTRLRLLETAVERSVEILRPKSPIHQRSVNEIGACYILKTALEGLKSLRAGETPDEAGTISHVD